MAELERRLDDGSFYTKQQFYEYYGTEATEKWAKALREPTIRCKALFKDEYLPARCARHDATSYIVAFDSKSQTLYRMPDAEVQLEVEQNSPQRERQSNHTPVEKTNIVAKQAGEGDVVTDDGQSNHTPVVKTSIVENQVGEGGSHEDVVTNEQKTEVHSESQRNPSDKCDIPVVPLDQVYKDGSKMENGLLHRATVQAETQELKLNLAAEDMMKAPTTTPTADMDSEKTNNHTEHSQKSFEAKSTIITGDAKQAGATGDVKLEKIPGSSKVEVPDRSLEDVSQTSKNEAPQRASKNEIPQQNGFLNGADDKGINVQQDAGGAAIAEQGVVEDADYDVKHFPNAETSDTKTSERPAEAIARSNTAVAGTNGGTENDILQAANDTHDTTAVAMQNVATGKFHNIWEDAVESLKKGETHQLKSLLSDSIEIMNLAQRLEEKWWPKMHKVITDNEAIQRQNEAIRQQNGEIQSQLHETQKELIETREVLHETKEHLKVNQEALNKTEERLKQLEEKFVRQSSTVESVFKTLQRLSQSFRPDFCAYGGSSGSGRPRTDPLNRDRVQNGETGF